jgi:PilZ domain-containing protein
MKKLEEQQRNAERIPLTEPVEGTLDSAEARITELSLIGAKVEHLNRLAMNSVATLQFKWRDQTIRLKARIARTEMRPVGGKMGYLSGVTFADTLNQAPQELRWMLGTFLEKIEPKIAPPPPPPPPAPPPAAPPPAQPSPPPPAKKAAPVPLPSAPAPFLTVDDEVEEIDAAAEVSPYVLCEYGEEGWKTTRTSNPKQPISGFTMMAPESDDEIDDFCRTYEMADPETQRMIRLSFELAITQHRRT